MEHTPIEKMSKKAKKKLYSKRRATWGTLNPVTRRPPNPKAYKRGKVNHGKFDDEGR